MLRERKLLEILSPFGWIDPKGLTCRISQVNTFLYRFKIDGKTIQRRYTVSSSPSRPERIAISVKRIEGGHVSNWLHENFQVGSTLLAEKPTGNFYLQEQAKQPLLLLSAGSGVTPMLSILRYLSDNDLVNDVVFYHQCSTEEDQPCWAELKRLRKTQVYKYTARFLVQTKVGLG